MDNIHLKFAKILSVLIFVVIVPAFVMAGWAIGTNLGYSKPEIWVNPEFSFISPSDPSLQAAGQGGLDGALLGLSWGSLLSYGGLGLITARAWRHQYTLLGNKHTMRLVLGWILFPIAFFSLILLFVIS